MSPSLSNTTSIPIVHNSDSDDDENFLPKIYNQGGRVESNMHDEVDDIEEDNEDVEIMCERFPSSPRS